MEKETQEFRWKKNQENKYQNWIQQGQAQHISDWLKQQWRAYRIHEEYAQEILFLDRPLQNGFHIKSALLNWSESQAYHFFYHLATKISGIEYVNQLKDIRYDGRETIHRLYYKPSIYRLIKNPTANKLYGNITLLYTINNTGHTIQLQCDRYSQRGDEFDPFEELMGYLLN